MRSVASLTPLRADISRIVMSGSGAEGGTGGTVAQDPAANKLLRFFYTDGDNVSAVLGNGDGDRAVFVG